MSIGKNMISRWIWGTLQTKPCGFHGKKHTWQVWWVAKNRKNGECSTQPSPRYRGPEEISFKKYKINLMFNIPKGHFTTPDCSDQPNTSVLKEPGAMMFSKVIWPSEFSKRYPSVPTPLPKKLDHAITGWWLGHPSEKYESQLGSLFPIYGKIKNVPKPPTSYNPLSLDPLGMLAWLNIKQIR